MKFWVGLFISSLACTSGQAQGFGALAGAGYRLPSPTAVAPGQIITLFIRNDAGVKPVPAVSDRLPWPSTLAGYSVSLRQGDLPGEIALPLQAVYPVDNCYAASPFVCSPLVALTVQIPWELIPTGTGRRPDSFATLTVSRIGVPGQAIPVSAVIDNIHVLTTCDATLPPGIGDLNQLPGPCRSVATHMDGRLVTAADPAKAGETVIARVFGLGPTSDDKANGIPVSEPIQIEGVRVGFEFGRNLEPVRQREATSPLSVMLSRFQPGLYEVAFVVPDLPEDLPGCTASTTVSNLTVTISRTASFDGVGLCVE